MAKYKGNTNCVHILEENEATLKQHKTKANATKELTQKSQGQWLQERGCQLLQVTYKQIELPNQQ